MTTILAVAIGDHSNSRIINDPAGLNGVRPYIYGLVNYLGKQPVPRSKPARNYTLGSDYVIDYRECWEDAEDFTGVKPALIFCMSTPVVRKARAFTPISNIPIVGVFSDRAHEGFDKTPNICGVNAQRIQLARKYYDSFLDTVDLTYVNILHRPGNTASQNSLGEIRKTPLRKNIKELKVEATPPKADPRLEIRSLIRGVPNGDGSGLLVLPVDLFFGVAAFINSEAAARNIPVFWPVSDFAPTGLGGQKSAPQETCGETMGPQVQFILENPGQIPQGSARFIDMPTTGNWVVSKAVATALKIKLGVHKEMDVV